MVELVIRLVFSLAVVIGMLLLLAKFSAKRFSGSADALVRVVHRQALSRTSSVAVVTVAGRVLVLGTTEHQVQLLTELDPEELDVAVTGGDTDSEDTGRDTERARPVLRSLGSAGRRTPVTGAEAARAADGALAGSILSAQTWKQAFTVASSRNRDAS